MNKSKVAFLAFDGCPLAPMARANLHEAMQALGRESSVEFEEIDLMDEATPEEIRRWGSPTILINGQDITGSPPGDASGCRIYPSEGGVPTTSEIINAIRLTISA